MSASGGPTEPTSASTTTAEHVLVGASSVVAIETVAAAKGSDAGDGGTVGADVMKAQELGSPQHEGVVGVAPEEKSAGEFVAIGAMHYEPGSEFAIGGGMMSGGQSSGVGASSNPMEPTSASSTTSDQNLVGASSVDAFQTVAAAKGRDAVQTCRVGLKSGGQSRWIGARQDMNLIHILKLCYPLFSGKRLLYVLLLIRL